MPKRVWLNIIDRPCKAQTTMTILHIYKCLKTKFNVESAMSSRTSHQATTCYLNTGRKLVKEVQAQVTLTHHRLLTVVVLATSRTSSWIKRNLMMQPMLMQTSQTSTSQAKSESRMYKATWAAWIKLTTSTWIARLVTSVIRRALWCSTTCRIALRVP